MKILLICEPRSGSTNFANWFKKQNNNFAVFYEPTTNKTLRWYQGKLHPNEWIYHAKHVVIKEVYHPYTDFTELINFADKVICLYRENGIEQSESYFNARKTGNWHTQYRYRYEYSLNENEIDFFKNLKDKFKELYVKDDFFYISYEDLYFGNAIKKVVEFLGIENLNTDIWPIGNKYRVNPNSKKLI